MLLERLQSAFAPNPEDQRSLVSPDTIKAKRALARKLMEQAGDYSPIQSGWQGVARVAAGLRGGLEDYWAGQDERAGGKAAQDALAGIFGGGSPATPAVGNPMATGASAEAAPAAANVGAGGMRSPGQASTMREASSGGYDRPEAREIFDTAVKSGLTPQQASGFVGSALAESSYRTDARNPGDGRDGSDSIGLFQWNGPRAAALKQFAEGQGKDWRDRGVQTSFALQEMQGSESFAGQALRNAKTPEDATAAMLHYLRPGGYTRDNPFGVPSAPARIKNANAILGLYGSQQPPSEAVPAVQRGPVDAGPAMPAVMRGTMPGAPSAYSQPAVMRTDVPDNTAAPMPVQTVQADAPARSAAPPSAPQPQGLGGSDMFRKAFAFMNSPAFAYATEGQKSAIQAIVNKGLSQEAVDPTTRALKEEQLTGARLSNERMRREMSEQGFTDADRPDGSRVRIFKDGTIKPLLAPMQRPEKPEFETREDPATGRTMQRPKGSSGPFTPVEGLGAKPAEPKTFTVGGNLYERQPDGQYKLAVKKADDDATPKRSLVPLYGVNEAGETVLLQPDDAGNANQMKLPPGVKVAAGVEKVDTGTEIIFFDRKTNAIVGRQPKDIRGKEVQEAIGAQEGKTAANASSAITTAEQTLAAIGDIKNHPANNGNIFGSGLGATGKIARALPGTEAFGFDQRVEQLKGKTFMEAYNGLRGGGAITDAEGAKATQALGRLNAAQSHKDFNAALADLESVVKTGMDRARAMGSKFGTVAPAATPTPDAPAQPQVRRYNPATGKIE